MRSKRYPMMTKGMTDEECVERELRSDRTREFVGNKRSDASGNKRVKTVDLECSVLLIRCESLMELKWRRRSTHKKNEDRKCNVLRCALSWIRTICTTVVIR